MTNTSYELMSDAYETIACSDSLIGLVASRPPNTPPTTIMLVRKKTFVDQTKLLLESILACQRYNMTLPINTLERHYELMLDRVRARPSKMKLFVEYMFVTKTPKKIEITPTSQLQKYMLSFETFKGKRKVAPKKTAHQAVITEDTAADRIQQTRKAAAFDTCGTISFSITREELEEFESTEIFNPKPECLCFIITNLVGTSHHRDSYLDEVHGKVSKKRSKAIKKIVGRIVFFFGPYENVPRDAILYSQLDSVVWLEPKGLNFLQLSPPTV